MTSEAQHKRRAMIVRRWAAYRIGQAQREIWRKRKEVKLEEGEETVGEDDLLAELPDSLLG